MTTTTHYFEKVKQFIETNGEQNTLLAVDISSTFDTEIFHPLMHELKQKYPALDVVLTEMGIVAKGKLKTLEVVCNGRGGQDYIPAFQYAEEQGYQGILFVADGYGRSPETTKLQFCWILNEELPKTKNASTLIHLDKLRKPWRYNQKRHKSDRSHVVL